MTESSSNPERSETMLDEGEAPPLPLLVKKTSSSSSFIGSFRRDLHPVVLSKATKKRKL